MTQPGVDVISKLPRLSGVFRGYILEEWTEGEWWRDDRGLLVDENKPQ